MYPWTDKGDKPGRIIGYKCQGRRDRFICDEEKKGFYPRCRPFVGYKVQYLMAALWTYLFLFVLFILWDYYRTKNEYFADYVDRWGIPEGVVELSAEQVKKRSTHYRFEYTHRSILGKGKGTLKRVVFANSAGFPI